MVGHLEGTLRQRQRSRGCGTIAGWSRAAQPRVVSGERSFGRCSVCHCVLAFRFPMASTRGCTPYLERVSVEPLGQTRDMLESGASLRDDG